MDVVISRGPDESIVPEPASSIETLNEGSGVKSLIFRLPTEITILIFQQCETKILPRLTLTHTCLRWRQIAVNTASLWTHIYIFTKCREQNASLDNFLFFLGMQLDRTANLLLDVDWTARAGDDFYVATLQLIREKAPFSRWRSLQVHIVGELPDQALWSSAGAFTNLESLLVQNMVDDATISAIDHTITARLRVVEFACPHVIPAKIVTCFAKSLTHISSLRLHSLYPIYYEPFLPVNVVNLRLDWAVRHLFPHVQTYKLNICIFIGGNTFDLRSMTVLVASEQLVINPDVQVTLPALRELTLGTLDMDASSGFEAPALDALYFAKTGFTHDADQLTCTQASLQQQGYLLSPHSSITADSHLPRSAVLALLARSPKVTHATMCFDDWECAEAVLGRLLGFKTGSYSDSPENETLCPRLSELKLEFGWALSDSSASKEWLLDALRSREDAGLTTPLSTSAKWAGEGAYVLLTGD